MNLGPHQGEEQPPQTIVKVKRIVWGMHQIPSAIIALAVLSLAANFAFGYFNIVGIDTPMPAPIVISEKEPLLGSDDEEAFVIPTFSSSTRFVAIPKPAALRVSAESYLVADADTGEIILEKNPDEAFPMASVTKLMTAIVAKENMELHHLAVVNDSSYNTYGAQGGLGRGEKILVADLFYPLLIESSNDAAEVLANDFGRIEFVTLLNQKAEALGMTSTVYDDPSGLSPNNVSTAHDLTKLGLYVRKSYPELLDITRVRQYAILEHEWKNANAFLNDPNFLGGKNGFIDEAKKTTVSYFKVFIKNDNPEAKSEERAVVVVLLRSDDRNRDAAALLSYVSRNIRYVEDIIE